MKKNRRVLFFVSLMSLNVERVYKLVQALLLSFSLSLLLIALPTTLAAKESEIREPTQPPMAMVPLTQASSEGFKLTSIIIGKHRRLAVINGSFVSIGERIAGAKVVSIRRNRVTLLLAGQVLKLYLIGNEVRKR